jgi:hypothetical protein
MKFSELKQTSKNGRKWATGLADTRGREDYEMAIRGRAPLVSRAFAKSEFEIQIDQELSGDAAQRRVAELLGKYSATVKDRNHDVGETAFKKPAAKVTEKESVVVSFRRTRGEGTFWAIYIPILFVPAGANFFFALPPVRTCVASVFPIAGDPDLFLTLNGLFTPTVAASLLGGTAVDTVSFTSPAPFFFPFVPFFRLNGFATGITGFFMAGF